MGTILATLRGWSPLGPIFGKELRTAARRRGTYLLRLIYLGALLLVLLCFHAEWSSHREQTAVQRAREAAELGETFFSVFAFFTWSAMALIGPVLTSTAINAERLRKTLPVLLMTPITAWQIVSGKLFSRLLMALSLVGLSLPVLAVVRLLGGVELDQVVAVLCLCTVTVLFTAAVALLLSVLINRAYAVILLSYALLGCVWVICPIMGAMAMSIARWQKIAGTEIVLGRLVTLTNPGFTLGVTVFGENNPWTLAWGWCVLAQLTLAGLLLGLSAILLRWRARREGEGRRKDAAAGAGMPPPPLVADDTQAVGSVPAGTCPANLSARTVADNPVLWREIRQPLMPRRWQRIAATVIVLGCLLAFYALLANLSRSRNELMNRETHMGFASVFCALLTLLTCIVSATAIAQEKESDTWTLLLATPLTAWQIVWGKFAGLLRRMLWPAALIVGHFILFGLLGAVRWQAVAITLFCIFTGNVVWLATGLYLSLRLKTVIVAIILNLLGPVLLYGGAALVLGFAGEYLGESDLIEVVGLYTPYYYFCAAIDWVGVRSFTSMPVFGRVSWSTYHAWMLASGLGYVAAAALILWFTTSRFDRIVGRARRATSGSGGAADSSAQLG